MAASDNRAYSNSTPSVEGSLAGVMRFAVMQMLQESIDNQLPAEVVSYDRGSNRASVRILVPRQVSDGSTFEREALASVPVIALGAGGFFLNFPVKAGDRGWIKASDRDLSGFHAGKGAGNPPTRRFHKFSDGVFYPDVMSNYSSWVDDAVVLSNLDGTCRISVSDNEIMLEGDQITMKATDVNLNARNVTIDAETVTMPGKVSIGTLTVGGQAYTEHWHIDSQNGRTSGVQK